MDRSAPDDGARLLDYAESPRVDDWTLRSALVRYAQPEPLRASAVLELVRRTDGALEPFRRPLERDEDVTAAGPLLEVAVELDRLGDVLAAWAADRTTARPDAEVDAIARQAFEMLRALGVEREQRPPRRS